MDKRTVSYMRFQMQNKQKEKHMKWTTSQFQNFVCLRILSRK